MVVDTSPTPPGVRCISSAKLAHFLKREQRSSTVADLDLDGVPEIVYGRDIIDADGRLVCSGTAGRGGPTGTTWGDLAPLSTIADLDRSERMTSAHIAEAIQYRSLEKNVM